MGIEMSALFKRNSALDILLHSCVVGHPKLDLDPRQTPGALMYRWNKLIRYLTVCVT